MNWPVGHLDLYVAYADLHVTYSDLYVAYVDLYVHIWTYMLYRYLHPWNYVPVHKYTRYIQDYSCLLKLYIILSVQENSFCP